MSTNDPFIRDSYNYHTSNGTYETTYTTSMAVGADQARLGYSCSPQQHYESYTEYNNRLLGYNNNK